MTYADYIKNYMLSARNAAREFDLLGYDELASEWYHRASVLYDLWQEEKFPTNHGANLTID